MAPPAASPVSTSDPLPVRSSAAGRPILRLVALALGCALLALLPAVWLLGAQQRALALHEQRLQGHAQLVAAAPLAGALPWHRDLSTRLLLGEAEVEGALRRAAAEVRSALRRVDAMLAQNGDPFSLAAEWRELDARWAHLESRYGRLSPPENVDAHNRLLQHVETLLAQLVQRAQITRAAAGGAHLLILGEIGDLPALSRHLAMLRAHALLAGSEPGVDRRERFAQSVHDARAALEQLEAHLAAAYAVDAPGRAVLEQRSARALALARGVLDEADTLLTTRRVPGRRAGPWFSTTTQAVESLQGVSDALSERVATLLAGEVETLRVRRGATEALAVLIGCCAMLAALVLGRALLGRGRGRTASAMSASRGGAAHGRQGGAA
jgi:hypothetical protein